MGEGHNAAASVLRMETQRLWPGCHVDVVDTVALRGRRFARTARAVYEREIRNAPWAYQRVFDAMLKHPWFAAEAKRLVSEFFGRALRRLTMLDRPDFIVSTFPLGNGAMHWLRSAAGTATPVAAFIPGFDIHPFWTWRDLDVHFVVHPNLVPDAVAFGARGEIRVCAPLVRSSFGDALAGPARRELRLRDDAFVVLVTGGSWGVGSVARAALTLARAGDATQVVAVCGRNEALRRKLAGSGIARERLVTLGFVRTMPQLIAASDVVVTNGAGVTVMESLASGRPVIAFDPLAGHGRLASSVLEREGLGLLCPDEGSLLERVSQLADGDLGERLRTNAAAMRSGPPAADALRYVSSLRPDHEGDVA